MESKYDDENIPDENSNLKTKKDWSFLNDIETLISEKNNGKKVRCIVYDTETTGLNFKKDHILELACVEVINFGLTGRTFHIYIKPRVFVTKKVQEINHINYDDYKKYWEYYNQDTKTQLQNFLEFIGEDSYLVAHNAIFDYYFLNAELKYWGLPEVSSERFRCTLRTVKKYFKSEGIDVPNNKLITCCEYFKILVNDNEGSFHNALFDTIMTSKLFIHLYKKFAKIDDFNVNEYNNKYAHFQYYNLQRNNKKKQENKESSNDKKKFNKKEYNNKKNNNDNKEINNNKNESNEDNESKLNGIELNKLIQKMNEMVIKEQNNESKKEQ